MFNPLLAILAFILLDFVISYFSKKETDKDTTPSNKPVRKKNALFDLIANFEERINESINQEPRKTQDQQKRRPNGPGKRVPRRARPSRAGQPAPVQPVLRNQDAFHRLRQRQERCRWEIRSLPRLPPRRAGPAHHLCHAGSEPAGARCAGLCRPA